MPQIGIRFAGEELTWDEARARAEDATFPYPPPLIEAMADQRQDQVPSASVIVGCLRRFELQRTINYFGDANGELPPLFGTAFHDYMDKYRQRIMRPGDIAERKLTTLVDLGGGTKVFFSGRMDFFSPGRLISDWKTKVHLPKGFAPPKEHIGQVNVYNWLAAAEGYDPAPEWELAYVTQTWAERFVRPTLPVARIGKYVQMRLKEWAQAVEAKRLPPPVPALFETDAKGQQAAPCRYCAVREECLAALRAQGEAPI